MPRVLRERHKVKQVGAPWAENRSRFTMRFEALVIDWLREASIAAVAHQMELSWDEVDRFPSASAWTRRRFRSATST